MSCLVVGATGLCGNYIVKHAPEFYTKTFSVSRKQPDYITDKHQAVLESDSTQWAAKIHEIREQEPSCDVLFSGLASNRHKSNGFKNQRKIDLDLNYDLAKAAKDAGFSTYVLVSSIGANSQSMLGAYPRMKGELEDKVIGLGFDQTIIIRPGAILGERRQGEEHSLLDRAVVGMFSWSYRTFMSRFMLSPIYGEEIAVACLKASKMKHDEKVVIYQAHELLSLADS